MVTDNAGSHVKTPKFLMFLRPNCMHLGPHIAVVMVGYTITSETCFISPSSFAATTIHRRPHVSDSHLVSDLARLCTELSIASQTVKACAQYFQSKSSHGQVRMCAYLRHLFYPVQYCIRLCYRQVISRYSSIVKISCRPDASRISHSVVQRTDDVDIGRTEGGISMGILSSSS
ncbi:hypothetical protein TNCT_565411 [Trichonephila clavata]|uniref:Uncharacterized protein n=1 Tax=Trichonephila clavata TaxID=2740835 RepID=A0A8X6G8Z5_TRICU|nr:hypothetical protein TNCT_565411 [Trichonephila clavata]